jgi:hypothetical protein
MEKPAHAVTMMAGSNWSLQSSGGRQESIPRPDARLRPAYLT